MNIIKITLISFICTILSYSCQNSSNNENIASENQTLETIMNRKSVREYSDKEITQETLTNLLKAGMAAPSSKDRRPWHLVVISDKTILDSLGNQLKTASMLKNANKAIVVCGDTVLSDNAWFLDCSAAAQNILIAAESMGIGSVWTAAYPYEDRIEIISNTLRLPENIQPLAIIPLGYPAGENKAKDKYDETRIHQNKW